MFELAKTESNWIPHNNFKFTRIGSFVKFFLIANKTNKCWLKHHVVRRLENIHPINWGFDLGPDTEKFSVACWSGGLRQRVSFSNRSYWRRSETFMKINIVDLSKMSYTRLVWNCNEATFESVIIPVKSRYFLCWLCISPQCIVATFS